MDFSLCDEFYSLMAGLDFNAYGIVDSRNHIHTLGTDSKIIGRVFEMFTQPVLETIAGKHSLVLHTPEAQTRYPDFVLMKDANSKEKIAIDIKTTYIDDNGSAIKFTLGSFASYMRNNTKNIEYKYTDYFKHYVIGFVYKRNGNAQESKVVDYSLRHNVVFPYRDVRYFIQEKYRIAGDKPGSGNTENIGSISSCEFEDFKAGRGPFNLLGPDVFELYWKYYPKYREQKKNYSSLEEFLVWCPKHIEELELLHPFDRKQILNLISEFLKKKS